MQEYVCSSLNNFTNQLYPTKVYRVKYAEGLTSKKCPNGMLQVSGDSIDGYFSRLLKCYVSEKGRYAIWGKRRIYEGYCGDIALIGVPQKLIETVKTFCEVKE